VHPRRLSTPRLNSLPRLILLLLLLLLGGCASEQGTERSDAGSASPQPASSSNLGPPGPEARPTPEARPGSGPNPGGGPRYKGLNVSASELEAIREACAKPLDLQSGEGYRGPIVDTHVHTALDNPQGPFALALLAEMNKHGVSRVVIQTDHSPDVTVHPGLLSVYRETEDTWGKIASVCPRILPLIYAFDPADDSSWDYVQERLNTGHFAGVGEIEFVHSKLGIRKPVHSKTMDRIYETLAATGGIFHFQAETRNEPDLSVEIEALIRSYPKIRFIWFAGQHCFAMKGVSNLACTLFPNDYMQRFGPFPDEGQARVVLGTDHSPAGFHSASTGHLPYESFGEGISAARRLLSGIGPQLQDDVAHGHFDRLVGASGSVSADH